MDPKILTEGGWKVAVAKFKIKDNGLQKALANYEKLGDEDYDDCAKALGSICQLAATLKKAKDLASNTAALKYLTEMASAAEAERKSTEAQAAAVAKAAAEAKKKEAQEKQKGEADEEEEEEEGDYKVKLLATYAKLKNGKDLSYQFIVCDAKPRCAVFIAKRITPKHKEELTKLTGGGKKFLKVGTCTVEMGKINFNMEQPPAGLARKLQESIKYFTGKKLPVLVGKESAEEAEDEEGQAEDAGAAASAETPVLIQASEGWRRTREGISASLDQLKEEIRKEYSQDNPDVLAEVEQKMNKLDGILENLDHKLADSLAKAHSGDAGARATELKNSKAILATYLNYVKSEPLIAEIDANPFGVKTNIKQSLTEIMTQAAKAIG